MTVLPWRSWTRPAVLRRLESMVSWVGLTFGPSVALKARSEQVAEDARLRAGPAVMDWSGQVYRRRPDSIVWHRPECSAWPVEPPWVQVTGRPGEGLTCRECGSTVVRT